MPASDTQIAAAPTAGLPTAAGKSRRGQVLISLGAGWVALHLPHVHNLVVIPLSRSLLRLALVLRGAPGEIPSARDGPLAWFQRLWAAAFNTLVDITAGLPGPQPPLPSPADDSLPVLLGNKVQPYLDAGLPPPMPECWGHRGASGVFPENTLPSFERAIQDGSEGIETDVHITLDDVILIFHDPALERTTDGHGMIQDQKWHGPDGVEHVRTRQEPAQQIPRFEQLAELMMRPDYRHVKANIDIKPENDPERLFRLLARNVRQYPGWETDLAPRILLGLWHPKFIPYALAYVPELTRVHIGGSPSIARQYFWPWVEGFSVHFDALATAEGRVFFRDAKAAGKLVTVWTVNRADEMVVSARWGADAVLTDNTALFRQLRQDLTRDFAATEQAHVSKDWDYGKQYRPATLWAVQTTRLGLMEARAKQPYGLTATQYALLSSARAGHSKTGTA